MCGDVVVYCGMLVLRTMAIMAGGSHLESWSMDSSGILEFHQYGGFLFASRSHDPHTLLTTTVCDTGTHRSQHRLARAQARVLHTSGLSLPL